MEVGETNEETANGERRTKYERVDEWIDKTLIWKVFKNVTQIYM